MIDLGVADAKTLFFDSHRVLASVDVATRQALSKTGAYVRTRARSSIRRRKKASPPGRPPSDHGGALKRLLLFAFDPAAFSTVVGPVKFGGGVQAPRAPRALEAGGDVTRVRLVPAAKGGRAATPAQAAAYRRHLQSGRLARPAVVRRVETLHYRPRPYMVPAIRNEIAAGTLTDELRGSIKG